MLLHHEMDVRAATTSRSHGSVQSAMASSASCGVQLRKFRRLTARRHGIGDWKDKGGGGVEKDRM